MIQSAGADRGLASVAQALTDAPDAAPELSSLAGDLMDNAESADFAEKFQADPSNYAEAVKQALKRQIDVHKTQARSIVADYHKLYGNGRPLSYEERKSRRLSRNERENKITQIDNLLKDGKAFLGKTLSDTLEDEVLTGYIAPRFSSNGSYVEAFLAANNRDEELHKNADHGVAQNRAELFDEASEIAPRVAGSMAYFLEHIANQRKQDEAMAKARGEEKEFLALEPIISADEVRERLEQAFKDKDITPEHAAELISMIRPFRERYLNFLDDQGSANPYMNTNKDLHDALRMMGLLPRLADSYIHQIPERAKDDDSITIKQIHAGVISSAHEIESWFKQLDQDSFSEGPQRVQKSLLKRYVDAGWEAASLSQEVERKMQSAAAPHDKNAANSAADAVAGFIERLQALFQDLTVNKQKLVHVGETDLERDQLTDPLFVQLSLQVLEYNLHKTSFALIQQITQRVPAFAGSKKLKEYSQRVKLDESWIKHVQSGMELSNLINAVIAVRSGESRPTLERLKSLLLRGRPTVSSIKS